MLLFNGQILSLVIGALMIGMTMMATCLVPILVRTATAGQSYWLQILEIVIIVDVGIYFVHRALQAVPWLWRVHAAGLYAWLLRSCYRRVTLY